ncbi:hypothetical protein B0A50_00122 [Salinomyces thailandicus]|uniref:DUF1275 domain protein n=1 Tax=Salinomyces thailandicus TaxID=706561 RepID=A0A4U0UGP2_9PEZI|nr:hypothetical protein B0A50_00122 [Salinomyces thailandica]
MARHGRGGATPRARVSRDSTPLLGEHQTYITFDAPNGGPPAKPKTPTRLYQAKQYLNADVSNKHTDIILIICFAISGLIDSGAYNAYTCFTSMQTGNTVFAALGVSDLPASSPKYAWTKSVTSVVSFLIGAAVLSTCHRLLGARKRWVQSASFFIQGLLIALSAYIVQRGGSDSPVKKPTIAGLPADPGFPWIDLVPIGLLSVQSAGKVVASRIFQHVGLPAVVLTTLFSDLVSDPRLFTAGLFDNPQRNGRFVAVACYFGGAVAGGAFAKSTVGFAGLLWSVAGIKLLIVISWLLWREDEEAEDEES